MNRVSSIVFRVMLANIFFAFSVAYADQEVAIESDEQLKEVFSTPEWNCEWKDKYNSGKNRYTFKEVNMKKITASVIVSLCPNPPQKFKAKIKKGAIVGKHGASAPCLPVTINKKVYKKSDGSYYLKGTYQFQGGGGSHSCVPAP